MSVQFAPPVFEERGADKSRTRRRGAWLRVLDPALVVMAAPFLLLPNRGTAAAVALLPLGWMARRMATGRLTVQTPADGAIAGLLFMTFVALFASFDLNYSFPKLCGILLGVAGYYAVVNANPRGRALGVVAGVLALGGAAVVGVGALGTDWFTEKVFRAGAVAGLPSLAAQLPRSVLTPERGGIHPNELAGTIVMVLPVSLSLALSRRVPGWIRLGLAVLFVVEAGVLVLTQSRGGWSGTLVGLAALGVVVWVRLGRGQGRIALGAAAAVVPALIGLVVFGPTRLLETMDRVVGGPSSSVSRVVLWSRAWDMIQDFPFTGVGLNTFPFVLDAWYPTFMSAPGEVIVHAHNLYLQMAVDLGIPGLLAFAALLWATARAAWTAARAPEPWASLALGCGIGLLAFAVYGLTDAITLGAKPGLFFWLEVATIALIARLAPNCPTGVADRQ